MTSRCRSSKFADGDDVPTGTNFETKLTAGKYVIGGKFLNDYFNPEAEPGNRDRNLAIRTIELVGPQEGAHANVA